MKTLESIAAFTPGSALWLIPDLGHSAWANRLDWYLGFQLRRAQTHSSSQLSEPLTGVLNENQIDQTWVDVPSDSPLMVSSGDRVPNRQTVMIPYKEQLSLWVQECHHVWQGLQMPNVRIFIPAGVSQTEFQSLWSKKQNGANGAETPTVEVVVDIGLS